MPGVKKPSEHLTDLLNGVVSIADTPSPILSWARLFIWQAAVEVAGKKTQSERQIALARITPQIRPFVERDAKRILAMRK